MMHHIVLKYSVGRELVLILHAWNRDLMPYSCHLVPSEMPMKNEVVPPVSFVPALIALEIHPCPEKFVSLVVIGYRPKEHRGCADEPF